MSVFKKILAFTKGLYSTERPRKDLSSGSQPLKESAQMKADHKLVHLQRGVMSDEGTFGMLSMDGRPLCVTCEDPWNDNKNNISCIPPGKYECRKYSGTKYKNVWILEGTGHRKAILIHAGNTKKNTEGCILVGARFGVLGGLFAILDSVRTINMLRRTLPDRFTLLISNPNP